MLMRKPSLDGRFVGPLLAGALFTVIGLSPCFAQENTGVIAGRVTDFRGEPQRVLVQLLASGDVPVNDMYTDSNGRFGFQFLPNGDYFVVVEAAGFQTFRQYIMLDLRVDPSVQVAVSLERDPKAPKSDGAAITGSRKIYEVDSRKPSRPVKAKALREFEKGNEKQKQGDLNEAARHYQKALEIDAGFYPALNNLGTVYLRQKDAASAQRAFEKSIELNPEDGEPYINLGKVFYEERRYDESEKILQKGLERAPRAAVGHYFLGATYLKLGEFARAESHLKLASQYDPNGMPQARLQLANLYLKRGEKKSAAAELEAYLAANPSDPQAAAIKKTLAEIKAHPAQ